MSLGSDRRSTRASVVAIMAALFIVTLSVNLQVPLYKTYAEAGGHSQGVVALTFALYVAVLIVVLVLLGGAADRIGSKTVVCLGLGFALTAHVAIIADPTLRTLLIARVLQGFAVALTIGAATAHIANLLRNPSRAARLSGTAVTTGLGSGGLLTSAALSYDESLVPISYYGVAVASVACLLLVAPLANHRAPDVALLRLPMVTANTLPYARAQLLAWSLTGVIIATLPAQLVSMGAGQWSGFVLFLAMVPGVLVQLAFPEPDPQRFMRIGLAMLLVSSLLFVAGIHTRSTALILVAAPLSALACFGFIYVGGLTAVLRCNDGARVRLVSGYYLMGYCGLGGPCIAVGFLSQRIGLASALTYVGAVLSAGFMGWRALGLLRAKRADLA